MVFLLVCVFCTCDTLQQKVLQDPCYIGKYLVAASFRLGPIRKAILLFIVPIIRRGQSSHSHTLMFSFQCNLYQNWAFASKNIIVLTTSNTKITNISHQGKPKHIQDLIVKGTNVFTSDFQVCHVYCNFISG